MLSSFFHLIFSSLKKDDSLPSDGGDGNNAEVSSEALLPTCPDEESIDFYLPSNTDLGIASETYNNVAPASTALQADTIGNELPILFLKISM